MSGQSLIIPFSVFATTSIKLYYLFNKNKEIINNVISLSKIKFNQNSCYLIFPFFLRKKMDKVINDVNDCYSDQLSSWSYV